MYFRLMFCLMNYLFEVKKLIVYQTSLKSAFKPVLLVQNSILNSWFVSWKFTKVIFQYDKQTLLYYMYIDRNMRQILHNYYLYTIKRLKALETLNKIVYFLQIGNTKVYNNNKIRYNNNIVKIEH